MARRKKGQLQLFAADKRCCRCQITKPVSDFHGRSRATDGLQEFCKDCASAAAADWYTRNREHVRTRNKAWREANPDTKMALDHRQQLKRYELTPEDYVRILDQQHGRCAICGSTDPGQERRHFSVDHDHRCCPGDRSCGLCVRGLLCRDCNIGLGYFREDVYRFAAATRYLGGTTLQVFKGERVGGEA